VALTDNWPLMKLELTLLLWTLRYVQDITAKWEKLRHPDTTAAQRIDIVHEILTQVGSSSMQPMAKPAAAAITGQSLIA